FFLSYSAHHPDLHSFPTRRSSDLNPHVSLCYASGDLQQVYVDCRAEWADDPADKARLWDLFATTPPPIGYDPIAFWPRGKEDPRDRKSTRLNSSHVSISYAVFCLK